MANDHARAQLLIASIGSGYLAAKLFREETGYNIDTATMNRVYKGEAKPAMVAFVRYGLTQALKHKIPAARKLEEIFNETIARKAEELASLD